MTADLSRPRIFNHLIKGAVFGLVGYRLALFAATCAAPWNCLLFVIVWLLAAGCCRNLHALAVIPRLELWPDELSVRYWKPTRPFSAAMFLPFARVVDVIIPWSEYIGCETLKVSGGDPWDSWEALYIDTYSGAHEIGGDVFARRPGRLMADINAYREAASRGPADATADVADFNRRRFARPLLIERSGTKSSALEVGCGVVFAIFVIPLVIALFSAGGALVMLILTGGIPLALASMGVEGPMDWVKEHGLMEDVPVPVLGGKGPLAVQLGVVGGWVFFVGMVVWCWLQDRADRATRVVKLGPDGLAVGRRLDELRLIPWEEVLSASVLTTRTRTERDGSVSERTDERLEVRLRDGSMVVLWGDYRRSLSNLAALIDPPPVKVALARRLMDSGEDAETAAIAAGLPAVW